MENGGGASGKKEGGMAFVGKNMTVSVAVSYSMAFNWPAYCCQFSFRLSLSLSLFLCHNLSSPSTLSPCCAVVVAVKS